MKQLLALTIMAVGVMASSARADLPDFVDLVEKQAPAVVVVTTEVSVRNNDDPFAYMQNDPMLEFFRRRGFFGSATPQRPQKAKGLGSGFVVQSDGYILTNAHVVDKADAISVKLSDKREFKAELVGLDRRTDVALLKINAQNLPKVKVGSTEKLKVGAWVVAIGASLGFENTVTTGIVSAKERLDMNDQDGLVPFIQHSAPINQGNSGGPLFNIAGEVVGINSRIYTPNQGFVGLSFSIPIDLAMDVMQQLKDNGKVSRGRLGVVLQPMTQALASSFGLDKPNGAIVAQVVPGSAADKAGLKVGDVILAINGINMEKPGDLSRQIASSRAGQDIKIKVIRDKQQRQLNATLDEANDDDNLSSPNKSGKGKPSKDGRAGNVGLVVEPLAPEHLRRLNIGFGLHVRDSRGPAQEAGLLSGDIIVGVVGQTVKSVTEFEQALKPGAQLALQVMRGDSVLFVPLSVPAK